MDTLLSEAIEEIQMIVSADGARLVLLDTEGDALRFRLELEDASCADCVMPPAILSQIVETSIRNHAKDESLEVVIDDPRS